MLKPSQARRREHIERLDADRPQGCWGLVEDATIQLLLLLPLLLRSCFILQLGEMRAVGDQQRPGLAASRGTARQR
jgi:hypothetical protein